MTFVPLDTRQIPVVTGRQEKQAWEREWICKVRDLERLEEYDLKPMVARQCAWMVRDTRRTMEALLETWEGDGHQPENIMVYVREYKIFLEAGLWWRVPFVRLRLVYDLRGMGKIRMAQRDFKALYDVYFPDRRNTLTVVQGLEAELHSPVKA